MKTMRMITVGLVGLLLAMSLSAAGQGVTELQERVIGVYETVSPSVVHITVRGTTEDMFMRPVPVSGSGSGFIFDALGHIVTNYHVIADADTITVGFDGVDCCPAELIGADPSTDLAVLRVRRADLPPALPLADSEALRVGQFVVAVGNPFGLRQTATFGIISALGRVIRSPNRRFIGEAIQTDAPVNPGNSGGPLLDLEGRVIGVNSQIISPVEASAGIGFAVPSNTVARVIPSLIGTGSYPHPYLGIVGFDLSPERVQLFREEGIALPLNEGVLILEVEVGGPADLAGLRGGDRTIDVAGFPFPVGGDIIRAVDGQTVRTLPDLVLYLERTSRIGQEVELLVQRGEEQTVLRATVGERPESAETFLF
jgi:S1-C subfamily serine protease